MSNDAKVVVITGASAGIGAALARRLGDVMPGVVTTDFARNVVGEARPPMAAPTASS